MYLFEKRFNKLTDAISPCCVNVKLEITINEVSNMQSEGVGILEIIKRSSVGDEDDKTNEKIDVIEIKVHANSLLRKDEIREKLFCHSLRYIRKYMIVGLMDGDNNAVVIECETVGKKIANTCPLLSPMYVGGDLKYDETDSEQEFGSSDDEIYKDVLMKLHESNIEYVENIIEAGAKHNILFITTLEYKGVGYRGEGTSKKSSKRVAAKKLLDYINPY